MSAEAPGSLDATLEPLALAAWPAAEREERGGWVLRATGGVTRRANSAWTGRATGGAPLAARIEEAERWYAARGLPALFQLAPCAAPAGLDAALAARGYAVEAPVVVVASPRSLPAAGAAARGEGAPRVALADAPSDAWLALATSERRLDGAGRAHYRGIVLRIPRPAAFALAWDPGGAPVGCGLAGVQGAWLGVAAMVTAPQARRRGVAGAVLAALAGFGARHGARGVWLQVEEANAAARALYARAGLREVYRLHYRRAPGG